MDTITTIAIIFVAVLVVAGSAGWFLFGRQRPRIGSEYEYSVSKSDDLHKEEEELTERKKRVEAEIQPIPPEKYEHFLVQWRVIQWEFANDPSDAVKKGNRLMKEVMLARGFPVAHFERKAADISLVHPNVVRHYRAARAIAIRNEMDEVGTEELTEAFLHYRALFDELLERPVELRGKAV